MSESQTSPENQDNRFVKCPLSVLDDTGLSGAALKVYLAITRHIFGDNLSCYPSYARLVKLTGYTQRYIRVLIPELESRGHLLVKRTPGRVSVYTPRNYSVTVNITNPGTIVSETPEPECHTPRNYSVTEERRKNKNKEKEFGKKNNPQPPKDPNTLKMMLDEIDLSKIREKFGEKIDVESVIGEFFDATLSGTAKIPGPNPYDYFDLNKGLRGWCRREVTKNPKKITTPTKAPELPSLKDYRY